MRLDFMGSSTVVGTQVSRARHERREDRHGALEAMRRFVEIAPGSEFLYKAGQAAADVNRPREAIAFLTQADPETGWLRGWAPYWNVLKKAHHMLGEHQEELAVARRARRLFPNLVNFELRALAALGRTEEVQALLEQLETGQACWVMLAGGELLLHDHLDPASQLLDRGIMRGQAWLSTLPTDTTSSHIGYNIACIADMLLLRGRVDEARVVLEQAVEQRADRPSRRRSHIGTLGIIAGMQGDRRKALEIDQYLAAEPWIWPTLQVWWHARIAASLGEIDEATAILQEAVNEGMPVAEIHLLTPLLEQALRDHPPFQELMRPKG